MSRRVEPVATKAQRPKRGEGILDYSARAYAQLKDRPVPELTGWPPLFPSSQHARRDKAVVLGGVFLAADTLASIYNAQINGVVSLSPAERAELRENWRNIQRIAKNALKQLDAVKE